MKSSRWCWYLDEIFVKINGEGTVRRITVETGRAAS